MKHGHKRGYRATRTYAAWRSMKARCGNPRCANYSFYGGRGIAVCERWLESFENFLADMRECPDGMQLDRIDSNGHYLPENCKWSTLIEQNQNRRNVVNISFNGKTQCIAAWERELGFSRGTIGHRIGRGMTPEEALAQVSHRPRGYSRSHVRKFSQESIDSIRALLATKSAAEIGRQFNAPRTTISSIKNGTLYANL